MLLQLTASSLWNRVTSSTLKRFSRRVFSSKSKKSLGQLEWNSFVYLTADEKRAKQKQRKGETPPPPKKKKTITRSKLTFYCLLELCLFWLLLIFKPTILVKFIHTFVVFFFSERGPFSFWINFGSGLNLIKFLHVQFTTVAIVLESENNSYTCKLHVFKSFVKLTPGYNALLCLSCA